MAHDLGASYRLAFGKSITIPDIEYQARRLTHGLNTNKVISDELRIGFSDEGQCKAGEVRNVSSGGLIFENHRSVAWIPSIKLIFEDRRHEAEFAFRNFSALGKNWSPLLYQGVFTAFVEHCCFMKIGRFGDKAVLAAGQMLAIRLIQH